MEKSIHSNEYALFLEMLRATRERVGLSQGDIATKLNATQSFVSKCERGERRLDIVELRAWCLALGIPLYVFVECFERSCSVSSK